MYGGVQSIFRGTEYIQEQNVYLGEKYIEGHKIYSGTQCIFRGTKYTRGTIYI